MNFLGELFHKLKIESLARPSDIKIFSSNVTLTNDEFLSRVLALSFELASLGVKAGDHVVVSIPSEPNLYIALYACLYLGSTYVPVNPTDPEERQRRICKLVKPAMILGRSPLAKELEIPLLDPSVFFRDSASKISPSETNCNISDDSVAYLIFTSGSTGVPKGIEISLSCIASFIRWSQGKFHFDENDIFFGFANSTFDLSVPQIFLPFLSGAKLFLPNESERIFPGEALRKSNATIAVFVPRVTDVMENSRQLPTTSFPSLKQLWFSGEQIHARQISLWRKQNPLLEIHNFYGPTEATFACAHFEVKEPKDPISIGCPLPHMNFELLNSTKNEDGDEFGELVITGPQVARKKYFPPNSTNCDRFFDGNTDLSFRTGDFVRKDTKGAYYWLRRIDDQRKIRGFRIELGEIEYLLKQCSEIIDAACLEVPNFSEPIIVVILKKKNSESIEGHDWRKKIYEHLSNYLPDSVIPQKVISRPFFPITTNGKLDRVKLSEIIASDLTANTGS